MDGRKKLTEVNSAVNSVKTGDSKSSYITSSCGTSSSCTCSNTDSSSGLPQISSKSNSSSGKSRRTRDPQKKAQIEELSNKASALQKELEERELRTIHLRRLQELENELVKLSDEEQKRILHIESSGTFPQNSKDQSFGSYDTPCPLSTNKNESEFDQVRRFCEQVKAGQSNQRFSGGANCRPCALRMQHENKPELEWTSYKRSKRAAGNNNSKDKDRTEGPNGSTTIGEPNNVKTLTALVEKLMAEIDKVRKKNAGNRTKIIKLCIDLKEKEASLRECSELLCHILHDEDDVESIVDKVQGSQLNKHIEYLRWILIRLQYENMAQESELSSLKLENHQKLQALNECQATKNRVCAQKKARETALLSMSTQGVCDLPLTADVSDDKKAQ